MDEKSIDICPINGLCVLFPQHPFAAHISSGSDTYRLFDFEIMQRSSPWLQASTIVGIQEFLCKMDTIAALLLISESISAPTDNGFVAPKDGGRRQGDGYIGAVPDDIAVS
jgi:hypothetical protein